MTSLIALRVLLIDDNELVLDTFLALARLSNPAWEVRTAQDHHAGFGLARTFAPHVICADIGPMPKPGLAFARDIRGDAQLRNTFLIAVTGWADVKSIGQIEGAGFDVRLTKPVAYKEFTQHIQAFAMAQSLR